MPKLVRAAVLAVFAAAFYPSAAGAADQTIVLRSEAITVPGYGVSQDTRLVPSPNIDGYVTAISADVVDTAGVSVPITSVMLHHVVLAKLGAADATCSRYVGYDGRTLSFPNQRFYAEGEERSSLQLPAGYGYPNKARDRWGLLYMLMNHKPDARTVYVQYTVRYVTGETLTPVRPYWLDVRNCRADPKFDVPGGGALFSTYSQTFDFTMPEGGRIVFAGGHLHGGGLRVELSDRSCGTRLFTSEPTWGLPAVKPVIHEPGPKHMTTFSTANGIPVAAGDRLRLTATYDNSLPHARAMGVMMFFLAPQRTAPCAAVPAVPADPLSHPSAPPRFTLPLVRQPVGPVRRVLSSLVSDFAYSAQRVVVARGSTFRWRFGGPSQHDVTLANGPVGFSSPSVFSGAFTFRFTKPGVYRLYCSLHPTEMTQVVTVR
jgi:plastocyanin